MEMNKIKKGMKVVVLKKCVGISLYQSNMIKKAKRLNQKFLYVVDMNEYDSDIVGLSFENMAYEFDYFHRTDIKEYFSREQKLERILNK